MEAIVSGRAGVALFWEGEALYSLRPGEDPVRRSGHEISQLLADGADSLRFDESDRSQIAERLTLEINRAEALHLALMLFDAELPPEVRSAAAHELDDLFSQDAVWEFVEQVLYSRPFPREADGPGAAAAASEVKRVAKFVRDLTDHQLAIERVWAAWLAIPDQAFAQPEAHTYALPSVVRTGAFRSIARLLEGGESLELFLVESLGRPEIRRIHNHRWIWQQWLNPFRGSGLHGRPITLQDDQDEVPSHSEKHVKGLGDRSVILERVQRQKAAIVDALAAGELWKAQRFLADLIDFQERTGGGEYAAMSLCDLAIQARELGYDEFSFELNRRAVAQATTDGWAWAQLGDSWLRRGQYAEAVQAFENAIGFGQHEIGRTGLAQVLRATGRLGEALGDLEALATAYPQNVVPRNGAAEILRDLGRHEQALARYEATIANFPHDVVARTGAAEVLRDLGRHEQALARYEATIADFPKEIVPRNGAAEVLHDLGRHEQALARYEATIANFPKNVVARNGAAEILRDLGRYDEALTRYEATVAEFRHDVVARTGVAEVLRDLGRYEQAFDRYEEIIADFPKDVVAPTSAAEVLRDLGRHEEALARYEATIANFPQSVVARNGAVEILRDLGRHEEALARYEATITEFPHDVFARNGAAEVLRDLGRHEEALARYEATIANFPQSVVARNSAAEVLRDLGRHEEALAHYEATIRRFPNDQYARNGRAHLLAVLGRLEDALAALPHQPPVRIQEWVGYHIRGMVLTRAARFAEALAVFESGVGAQLPREQADYFKTALAMVELRRRNQSRAVAILADVKSPAVQAAANVLLFHAHRALGNKAKAGEIEGQLRKLHRPPRLVAVREELWHRYIEGDPRRSDEWLHEQELELLVRAA